MSVSTDGILVFGIDLGEERPDFLYDEENEEELEFDDYLYSLSGLPQWGEPDFNWDFMRDYLKDQRVDMTLHCSYNYPMFILSVRGTEHRNSRGTPTEIEVSDLKVSQEDIEALKKFCEDHDIEWQEPKWYLVSMWG